MRLYLLRHADADTPAPTDDERALSEKGGRQAMEVGRFCAAHEMKPDVILTSPLRRARQTARPVADRLAVELETVPWLACGAAPAAVLGELAARKNLSAVMLVGHEPDLGRLVAHLLGAKGGDAVHIRKASLTSLEIGTFRAGGGRLEFSVPVSLMA